MNGVWGNSIKISIFGESHGKAVGINIGGLPPGIQINMEQVLFEMNRRAPKSSLSTSRKEEDTPDILSGLYNNKTTGMPICAIIQNNNVYSKDYNNLKSLMRPSHSDYPAHIRYKGFNDYRGGGHFSGRLTAPLVFAGAICKQILGTQNIHIGSHISSIKNINDNSFDYTNIPKELLKQLSYDEIPLINKLKENEIKDCIKNAKNDGDSVGGVIECAIIGVCAGIGEPFFASVESTLAQLLFSVPAVKGVEFGLGFDITKENASDINDELYYDNNKIVKTKTNNSGGIQGGITNGMPIVFKCAIKPTSSISKKQDTINLQTQQNDTIEIIGRHDPCIVHRAVPVVESVSAIGILDLVRSSNLWTH